MVFSLKIRNFPKFFTGLLHPDGSLQCHRIALCALLFPGSGGVHLYCRLHSDPHESQIETTLVRDYLFFSAFQNKNQGHLSSLGTNEKNMHIKFGKNKYKYLFALCQV